MLRGSGRRLPTIRLATRASSGQGLNRHTPNLRTQILGFRGFDSSIIFILMGGFLMAIGSFPESLSQQLLVWRICREIGHISRQDPLGQNSFGVAFGIRTPAMHRRLVGCTWTQKTWSGKEIAYYIAHMVYLGYCGNPVQVQVCLKRQLMHGNPLIDNCPWFLLAKLMANNDSSMFTLLSTYDRTSKTT